MYPVDQSMSPRLCYDHRAPGRRGQIRVDELHWDLKKKEVRVTLTSKTNQEISLILRRGTEKIVTEGGKKLSLEGGISAKDKAL